MLIGFRRGISDNFFKVILFYALLGEAFLSFGGDAVFLLTTAFEELVVCGFALAALTAFVDEVCLT